MTYSGQRKETYLVTRTPDASAKALASQVDGVLLHSEVAPHIILSESGLNRLQEFTVPCDLGQSSQLLNP